MDNPVRTYSSGMYMRLAFSVAINVNADILLIDEILAVGDVNFQAKCFNKLREIKAQGTTIVIVSHSMGQIEQICDRSIWIHEGKIKAEGIPRDIDMEYLNFMGEKREADAVQRAEKREAEAQKEAETAKGTQESENCENQQEEEKTEEPEVKKRWGNGKARFKDIYMTDASGKKKTVFASEESVRICMSYTVKNKVEDAVFGIGIFRSDGLQCYGTNTRIEQFHKFDLEKDGDVVVNLKRLLLLPGKYTLDVAIESDMATPVDYYKESYIFEVYSSLGDVGVSRIEHAWEV